MKWIAYGEIMSVLFLFKSVKNVILVNRVIKTLYAPGDKCDYVCHTLPEIKTAEANLKFHNISSSIARDIQNSIHRWYFT